MTTTCRMRRWLASSANSQPGRCSGCWAAGRAPAQQPLAATSTAAPPPSPPAARRVQEAPPAAPTARLARAPRCWARRPATGTPRRAPWRTRPSTRPTGRPRQRPGAGRSTGAGVPARTRTASAALRTTAAGRRGGRCAPSPRRRTRRCWGRWRQTRRSSWPSGSRTTRRAAAAAAAGTTATTRMRALTRLPSSAAAWRCQVSPAAPEAAAGAPRQGGSLPRSALALLRLPPAPSLPWQFSPSPTARTRGTRTGAPPGASGRGGRPRARGSPSGRGRSRTCTRTSGTRTTPSGRVERTEAKTTPSAGDTKAPRGRRPTSWSAGSCTRWQPALPPSPSCPRTRRSPWRRRTRALATIPAPQARFTLPPWRPRRLAAGFAPSSSSRAKWASSSPSATALLPSWTRPHFGPRLTAPPPGACCPAEASPRGCRTPPPRWRALCG
mmetsp:Transcript_26753/g.100591  ORF Transcript_26753/g.100591 Transcript_26753/m.100591 type:complete len:440 (+) Transcript_26753:2264-3583(+)